jgi:hypothetical protein
MSIHHLKINKQPFDDLVSGRKTGEVRDCSDRDFKVGDSVELFMTETATGLATESIVRTITHIQRGYGLPDDICVLSYAAPVVERQPVASPLHGAWIDNNDDLLERLITGKATEGDQLQAHNHIHDCDIYEDVYGQLCDLMEPYVKRAFRPDGVLPASIVEGFGIVFREWAELAELQATIARLRAELGECKGEYDRAVNRVDALRAELAEAHALFADVLSIDIPRTAQSLERMRSILSASAEPPAPATTECTSCDGSGEYIDAIGDWRGYCSCPAGVSLKNRPAPVAVVMPERLTPAELEELEVIEVLLHGQGLSNLAGTMAAARQFIDEVCHPANKERAQ